MIVKQTVRNHFKVLWITIFTTVLYGLGLWFFQFERGIIVIFLAFYTLTVIPSFFLHISYYIRNKGWECEILPDRLRLKKNGKQTVIANSEIKEIVVYKSASIEKGGIPITPMEAYFFVRILDKAGNTYKLTCLMDSKIDKSIKILSAVPIYTERGLFNNL